MIQVNNLNKSYGQQVILDNVSFTLDPGERLGLAGRNGYGKTTLLRMILGQEHPDSGTIKIPNNYILGHLSQHIRFTENSVLQEACLSLPKTEDVMDETYKAETILMGLGFSIEDLSQDPMELSGGFQVRLNLAKVLVSDPNLLLLDEPTNYLDIVSMRWLGRFLRTWKKELIIITHDRVFMDSVTTHTMIIHRCGVRKEPGPTEKIYSRLLQEEEIYEQTRINDDKKRKEVEQFINRFRAKATKAKAVQSRIKALQKTDRLEKLAAAKDLEFTFNSAPFTGKQLMEVKDLSFGFDPETTLLIKDLSFYVGKNDRIAIIGKNGKGKTTLLSLLAGELSPTGGNLHLHRDLKLAYFGQTNIDRLNPEKTVEEEIMDVHPIHSRGKARAICGAMMFPGDQALKKVSVLSGGERSRVLLGKLLVSPTNMLLLDEPTNHLDMESTESLVEAIDEFSGALMIVTHSEMILHTLATRLIVFNDRKVTLFEGTYQDFLDRVGWKSEAGPIQPKTNPAISGTDKKDLRRVRGELINEKSRTLGALQTKIDDIENEIMRLEKQTDRDNNDLLEASKRGDGEIIKTLSKTVHESSAMIESLFSELDLLHTELESKTKEFEEKLQSLTEQ
ncbi:putative ABC transporter ATP-binding protein YheS [bacterium BMS3Bbin09]|nr:putative ABC transporter ATP-binding protein YheS [bacterium BMS3Bbin09]HDN94906.1 ATP-binding cassette domain-containing protein [Nitrospirota bacterium]